MYNLFSASEISKKCGNQELCCNCCCHSEDAMPRISTRVVFKVTFALVAFVVMGQIFLLTLCRCKESGGENPLAFRSQRTMRNTQDKIRLLAEKIRTLQVDVENLKEENTVLKKRNQKLLKEITRFKNAEKVTITQDLTQEKSEVSKLEFLKVRPPAKSEYEVVPFDAVAYNAIYQLDNGLSGNPAERPYGFKGKDFQEALNFAVTSMTQDFEGKDMETSAIDIVDGIMRVDRLYGSQYDFFFRTATNPKAFHRVKIQRPFGPLRLVGGIETIDTNHEMINLILPLSGRIEKFRTFIDNFVDVCLRWDKSVFLTVVFYGQEGREVLESLLINVSKAENFSDYKIIFSDEPFSRGAALQKGVLSWDKGNVLMFFCDVDVFFTAGFLNRCRLYSAPGSKVYYPVVFSLYNPVIVYGGVVPPARKKYRISRDTGYWRDFGFGMTCQYRSDFLNIGGFDLSIKGWGLEDVKLYRNYLTMNLIVIRAVDRGIFHAWHPKYCSRNLTNSQYLACIKSKVKSEASHSQLGLLAFGEKIFEETQPNWSEQLQASKVKHQ